MRGGPLTGAAAGHESVAAHIAVVEAVGDPASMTLALRIRVDGPRPDGLVAHVRVSSESSGAVFVDDRIAVTSPEVVRTVTIGDGGIDDAWGLCWWPFFPHLLNVDVALVAADGHRLDEAQGDAALRSFTVEDGHFCVNGRPYPLRLVLDQGDWPDTGATPPSVEALRTDLALTRSLGFNGVRKHQKTEDPRFFALADRMGLLTWVEMPSAYRAGPVSAAHLTREWSEVVAAHRSFASVAAWVPVNESWGVMGVAHDPRQRALVASLAQLTDALDGSRPVSANDGWETVGGDIVGIHDYDQRPDVLRARYGTRATVDALLAGTRSDGKPADVDRAPLGGRAAMLTEFGGTALAADTTEGGAALGVDGSSWGYDQVRTGDELVARCRELWAAVHDSEVLAGACWTQLTDTYQEVNGLLRAGRTPKAPVDEIAAAVKGR